MTDRPSPSRRWQARATAWVSPAAGAVAAVAFMAAPGAADEQDAVLTAVDGFFRAFAARDAAALSALMLDDGFVRALRPTLDGAGQASATRIPDWIAAVPKEDHAIRELYWEPVVQIRGPLASVWTPYEVFVDGATFQCGIDLFTLIDTADGWRITELTYTAEPTACDELRPLAPDARRPADLAAQE